MTANYKPYASESITVQGIKRYIPSNATAMQLTENTDGNGAADSFYDVNTNAVYEIPTGKKFIALGALIVSNGVTAGVSIYGGDVEDAVSTLKTILLVPAYAGVWYFAVNLTFLDTKPFIVQINSSTGVEHCSIFGYEVLA